MKPAVVRPAGAHSVVYDLLATLGGWPEVVGQVEGVFRFLLISAIPEFMQEEETGWIQLI